jgi:hypothetical protein
MILVPDELIHDNTYITLHMCHIHNLPKHVKGLKKVICIISTTLLGNMFLHINRIKEKVQQSWLCVYYTECERKGHRFWVNGQTFTQQVHLPPPRSSLIFFCEIWYSGARNSIHRNVGLFLAECMVSNSKILSVKWYFNGFITDTGKSETVSLFTSTVGIRKTPKT